MAITDRILSGKTILLGVTGSIAAYKSAMLASRLIKLGANVHVVMTKNATEFIAPLTFSSLTGNRCIVDMFDTSFEYEIGHISLAKKTDLAIVAPATANVIAKLAHGLADDMLTTTLLAVNAPILISPAMNTAMYNNQITQENISKLKSLGMTVINPAMGRLACGDEGAGKMPEPDELLEHILIAIGREKLLSGKKVLISAGPTRESIDPVRFISNHSTGKMGYALALNAAMMGAEVTLVSGPTNLAVPCGVNTVYIDSAAAMYEAVTDNSNDADIIIMSAAVADFTPAKTSDNKIKKSGKENISLDLESTRDILSFLGENKKPNQFIAGFSMETENVLENSTAKLTKKKVDMIVANDLNEEGAGFAGDTNVITIITGEGSKKLPLMSKDEAAYNILKEIAGTYVTVCG